MKLPLRLCAADVVAGSTGKASTVAAIASQPDAWFLPVTAAEDALEELSRSGWAEPDTKLFAVPRSTRDRALAGLLVVPAVRGAPNPTPRAMACRCVCSRIVRAEPAGSCAWSRARCRGWTLAGPA